MATTSKQRQPRLRASCDGCFLAKVKCSKARPICSRCLTCGIECRYSPSSRAGKPKASESAKNQQHPTAPSSMAPSVTDETMMYAVNAGMTGVYKLETGWTTPPTGIDGALSRNQSTSSGLTFMGVEHASTAHFDTGASGEVYRHTMPWTPPNDMPATVTDSPVATTIPCPHSRSQSYDNNNNNNNNGLSWVDPTSPDVFQFNQVMTPPNVASNYFPSPTATPNMRPLPPRLSSTSINTKCGSCICFTVCLQSLQALHNASAPSPPPFDLVLSLNRKAVEGCAAMLGKTSTVLLHHHFIDILIGCTRCMRRSGTHTAAMLLATVLGTITTFYKNASQMYFDPGTPMSNVSASTPVSESFSTPNITSLAGLGVSLGAYTINSEDSKWFELEILRRELQRLDEVYSSFREVCSDLSEDPEVSKAMLGYLGENLGSTMHFVSHRKGDMGYL